MHHPADHHSFSQKQMGKGLSGAYDPSAGEADDAFKASLSYL